MSKKLNLQEVAAAVGGTYVGAKVKPKTVDAKIDVIIQTALSAIKYDKSVIEFVDFVDCGLGSGMLGFYTNIGLVDGYTIKNADFLMSVYDLASSRKHYEFKVFTDAKPSKSIHSEKIELYKVGVDNYIAVLTATLSMIAKEAKKSSK